MDSVEEASKTFDPNQFMEFAKDPENFPPNKLPMWNHPKEEDGWMHAHNSIRAEIECMKGCLENVKGRDLVAWEKECIKSWWAEHEKHVHDHHSNEDTRFVPLLSQRFIWPEKMEADHEALIAKLGEITEIVNSFNAENTVSADVLYEQWVAYQEMMLPHLEEEESTVLPMTMQYFEPEIIGKLVEGILSEAPDVVIGSFIHCMTAEKFRNSFMVQEGIPFFVWYLKFSAQYEWYLENMVALTDALMNGEPPKTSEPACAMCSIA